MNLKTKLNNRVELLYKKIVRKMSAISISDKSNKYTIWRGDLEGTYGLSNKQIHQLLIYFMDEGIDLEEKKTENGIDYILRW